MSLTPGAPLGAYEILSLLGAGGMGEVYRARDPRLGREVAIKVLPAAVAASAERLARFEHEARMLAGLNHPNIVMLHTIEEADGVRFLTMELVDGQSLDRCMMAGGLPVGRVVELGTALADALASAHAKGVVHRDLKPGNVMLTGDGRVKVLDFGLARVVVTPEESLDVTQGATAAAPLTRAGEVVGTVPYMAPEQLRGEPVDGRTDVFALGVLLYELAAGERPFGGATLGLISAAILRDEPPSLTRRRPEIPVDLARIVARCLEKDPVARYQTAGEVLDALRHVRQEREGGTMVKLPPVPPTPLLGREETLAAATARLRDGARLLSVTGYGGTGKTRFAIELFRRLAPDYPGGAAFVSLASVTAAADVMPMIGAALEIAEAHGRSALDALATVIGSHRTLLVLDNLEQVLDAAEEIAGLVARCPSLQVIATSRAPLKIGAESEFELPPLALPPADARSPEALAACSSVELFLQRAAKVKPGFRLTADNAPAVASICRRLDGLPLALELAAARIRAMEPAGLLQRLDHALDLLTSGDRDLPLRQRTLRATISWSYSLLSPEEQRLLRWCSVFHEGWTLEALEQACYMAGARHRALDDLGSLIEKGLVRVVNSGERYALLETIRAFAAEQLHAGGEMEQARQSHADHFLAFSAGVAVGLRRPGQVETMRLARAENANTQAALHWLSAGARQGHAAALEQALLLCGCLDWVWHIAGLHDTGRLFLDDLLPLAERGQPSRGRALARLAAGMISTTTGEWARSLGEWRGGYEDGEAIGDPEIAAEGLMGVGYCQLSLGRPVEAAAALDGAIARSDHGVSPFMHALSMAIKGMLVFSGGDLPGGLALVNQAREIQASIEDHEGGGVALSFLAVMTGAQGDHRGALSVYRDALASFEAVGDHPEIARVHCEMGWTALDGGQLWAARESFRRAVRQYEENGSPRGTGQALLGLAAVDAAEGRTERAVAIARAAASLSERAGVVVDHPKDPGFVGRIEALTAGIPAGTLQKLEANARVLTPAAILALIEG